MAMTRDRFGFIAIVAAGLLSSFEALSLLTLVAGFALYASPLAPVGRLGLDRVAFGLAAIVWLTLAAIEGRLDPTVDGLLESLKADGRVTLVYFFMFSSISARWRQGSDRSGRFIEFAAVVLVGQAVAHLVAYLIVPSAVVGVDGLLHGLSSSHHIPGSTAALGVLLVSRCGGWRVELRLVAAALCLAELFAAHSRASLIALIAVLSIDRVWYWLRSPRRNLVALVAAIAFVLVLFLWPTAPSLVGLDAAWRAVSSPTEPPQLMDARSANVYTRFGLFGEALSDFGASPIIGTGPLSFDDEEQHREILPFVARSVAASPPVHTDRQAHNLLLHLLAEGGLVFGSVMLLPWVSLLRRLAVNSDTEGETARRAVYLGFWAGVATMGILTPATGLPICALAVSVLRSRPATGCPALSICDQRLAVR